MKDMNRGDDISIFILDSMADDIEDFASVMRGIEAWRSSWPYNITEVETLAAIKDLISGGYINVYDELEGKLIATNQPLLNEIHLRKYWYSPTEKGREMWRRWNSPPEKL